MKTVFVDANIVIRLLVKDDEDQLQESQEFFKKVENRKIHAIFSILVISEIVWILERFYHIKKSDFIPQVQALFELKKVEILESNKQIIFQSLQLMKNKNVDFTDAYLFVNKGEYEIFSFDRDFEKMRD